MKKQFKRGMAMAAVLAMIAGCVAGCGKQGGAGQTGKGDDTITVAAMDYGQVVVSEGTYEDNRWTKMMNEKSGVTVKWIPIIHSEINSKLSAMFAARSAPDIIVSYDNTFIGNLVSQGVLMPLDEVIEKYSTDYKKYLADNQQLLKYMTFDGKIYALTSQRSSLANHGAWIRQDWLDKLGLDMPTTDEELLEVARAFKTRDPNGNGQADEIPFASVEWRDVFLALYQGHYQWYKDESGAKIEFGGLTDRHRDGLAYIKTLYDEGLLDAELLTDKDTMRARQQWATGQSGIFIYSIWAEFNRELMKNDPSARPVFLPPVSTKYGKGEYYCETDAGLYVAFNKDIKNPQAAVKFLDWMIGEGCEALNGGEGEYFNKMASGFMKPIDTEKIEKEQSYSHTYRLFQKGEFFRETFLENAGSDELSQILAQQQTDAYDVYNTLAFRRDIPRNPDIPELARLLTEWGTKRDSIRSKIIASGASYSAQQGEDDLRAEWKRLGGDEITAKVNEWYAKNKADFE